MFSELPPNEVENILFIVTDQQQRDSLGTYGNQLVDTPHADAIAERGIRFDQAYTPTSICSPARASLLTGRRPFNHKVLANAGQEIGYRTEVQVQDSYSRCVAEIDDGSVPYSILLKEAGYNTGLVGKWHIGTELSPSDCGFDGVHYEGWAPPLGHGAYRRYLDERNLPEFGDQELQDTFPADGRAYDIGGIDDRPPEASFTYFLGEETVEMLDEYAEAYHENGTPFFLTTNFYGPHNPYFLPEEYLTKYDPADIELPESAIKETFLNKPQVQQVQLSQSGLLGMDTYDWKRIIAAYWGYVSFIDEQVGRIRDRLSDLGLADSTAIVFTTDHGGFVTSHKFHDKGPAMYEETYRIPLVTEIPGLNADRAIDDLVSLLDLIPTFLDIAGVEVPESYDGRSLFGLFGDNEGWRDVLTAEFHGHMFPYSQRMLRTDKYKLIVNPPDIDELYDLEDDPHELENIINSPELTEDKSRLYERLYTELAAVGDEDFAHDGIRKGAIGNTNFLVDSGYTQDHS